MYLHFLSFSSRPGFEIKGSGGAKCSLIEVTEGGGGGGGAFQKRIGALKSKSS